MLQPIGKWSKMKCIVEMYGLPDDGTEHKHAEIQIKEPVSLPDIIAALKHAMPVLEGEVIRPGEKRLTDYYTLNINGKFYTDYGYNQGDTTLSINDGDRIIFNY